MVGARSAAMAFNRILDADIDARNQRTAARHLPAGLLSRAVCLGIYDCGLAASFWWPPRQLGPVCAAACSGGADPPVFLFVLQTIHACARTWCLGFCLGMAPAAAWIAMRGTLDARILWLTAAVMFWTAGFDVIYACQDYEFDVREGLFSIPRAFGVRRALMIARLLHVVDDRYASLCWWSSSIWAR